jgi:hypothetical protein
MKEGGMFFDVRRDSHKILIDEPCGRIVRVGFGLQPNASASGRSRAEVNQRRSVVCFRLGKRSINVFVPFNSHLLIPL